MASVWTYLWTSRPPLLAQTWGVVARAAADHRPSHRMNLGGRPGGRLLLGKRGGWLMKWTDLGMSEVGVGEGE
jgi:hypothetical protein